MQQAPEVEAYCRTFGGTQTAPPNWLVRLQGQGTTDQLATRSGLHPQWSRRVAELVTAYRGVVAACWSYAKATNPAFLDATSEFNRLLDPASAVLERGLQLALLDLFMEGVCSNR